MVGITTISGKLGVGGSIALLTLIHILPVTHNQRTWVFLNKISDHALRQPHHSSAGPHSEQRHWAPWTEPEVWSDHIMIESFIWKSFKPLYGKSFKSFTPG
jgi:hypothetical protein